VPLERGALAAVYCSRPVRVVAELALYTFPDSRTLDRFWQGRMEELGRLVTESDEACVEGRTGMRSWEYGRIACYVDGGQAKIRWIDERTDTYGVLNATGNDLAALHAFWIRTAR
jgi:hypothetical protein